MKIRRRDCVKEKEKVLAPSTSILFRFPSWTAELTVMIPPGSATYSEERECQNTKWTRTKAIELAEWQNIEILHLKEHGGTFCK